MRRLNNKSLEIILSYILSVTTIGLLVVRNWVAVVLLLAAFIAILILITDRLNGIKYFASENRWLSVICLAYFSPVLAILISQTFRQEYQLDYYDSPSRFLFSIPVLYVLIKKNIDPSKYLGHVIPLTLYITLIALPFLPKKDWALANNRLTTFFVDPLTFGRYCLEFSLITLLMINIENHKLKESLQSLIFKLGGATIGIWLSIQSGSRTGWLSFPIILILFITSALPYSKSKSIIFGGLIALVASVSIYSTSNTVKTRLHQAIHDIIEYKWNAVSQETSVGMRISIMRMGAYFLALRPLSGWGDREFEARINDPEVSRFADNNTRQLGLNSGFHNEFITNAVRSGIWGIASVLCIFIIPFIYFVKRIYDKPNKYALVGISFLIMEFTSAMSTEVLNLKFTATFFAIFLACLIASSMHEVDHPAQEG